MQYDKWLLNQKAKAITCPRCQNEEIHPDFDFCKICGTELTNKCAGTIVDSWNNNDVYDPEPCDTLADGNARHCVNCGSPTTYYKQKLLVDWQVEYNRKTELLNKV